MNGKYFGEIGQNVVIGELSKYGVGIAIPLGDNLPFDLIAIVKNRLYKLQVKSSSQGIENESVMFDFASSDFYAGEVKRYSKQQIDFIVGVDLRTYRVYLFDEFEKKRTITLRLTPTKNNQRANSNWHEDFILDCSRIKELFDFIPPSSDGWFSKKAMYQHTCECCEKSFGNKHRNAKYCGAKCNQIAQRRVIRPSKKELQNDIKMLSWRSMGRKHGVSDNAVRKWARGYGLID